MEASNPIDTTWQESQVRRTRALEAIQRFRPMSIATQLVVLVFASLVVLLVAFTSFFIRGPNPAPYIAILLLMVIANVAANAMRTQRRLNALVDFVLADRADH